MQIPLRLLKLGAVLRTEVSSPEKFQLTLVFREIGWSLEKEIITGKLMISTKAITL